jgi:site-specific recombinase XerD
VARQNPGWRNREPRLCVFHRAGFKVSNRQFSVRDLKIWLNKVGLPFHSPHKFRHGNAVYALKLAKDIAALKAVSQNLMHSNISITNGVYGILSKNDVKGQIVGLGQQISSTETKDIDGLMSMIRQLLDKLSIDKN